MTQHRHPFYDDYDLQLIDDWNNQGNVQPDLLDSLRASSSAETPWVEGAGQGSERARPERPLEIVVDKE